MIKFNPEPYGIQNVHLERWNSGPKPDDPENPTINVTLTYPPRSDDELEGKIRYVEVNQESVRASDGVRLHYDYDRDGFVVEQPATRFVLLHDNHYDTVTDWTEVGFFQSWALDQKDDDTKFAEADAAAKEGAGQ